MRVFATNKLVKFNCFKIKVECTSEQASYQAYGKIGIT